MLRTTSLWGQRLSLFLLLLGVSLQVQAKRWGLAAKYTIPPMADSHIIMGQSSEDELNPSSIKVLVWNLLKAERADWSMDFLNLAQDKDLLLLQEGYLNPVMEGTFMQMYPFRFDFGISFLYNKDNGTPTGTVLGSRVGPEQTGLLRTSDYEPFIKTPKTITYGVYPIRGTEKDLLVMSIHAINFTPNKFFENQLRDSLKLIRSHSGPVIFAGDFNTWNKKRLKFLEGLMVSQGLKAVGFRNDKRKAFLGHPLDHAYARGLLVRDSRVVVEVDSSDHKALEVEFALDPVHLKD